VTKRVVELLIEGHLTRHPLDAEISQRMLTLFLKTLDPWKMYFYKSDADAFTQRQGELVEKARRGDVTPGYTIFNIYLQRLDERMKLVDDLLAQTPDFTVDEEMITDPKLAEYPATPADAREVWRKRLKFELLTMKADKEKPDGKTPQDKLSHRYHGLAKRMHQIDSEDLLEMYLNSLTSSLDPHSNYMSPNSVENFDIMMKCELEGIGASLQWVDGYTVVKQIVPGGAAEKDKRLKVEDKIVAVGQGREGEMVDVIDMKLNDVVKMIRGKRGTVVRLEVTEADNAKRKVIDIVREKIELKDSEAQAKVFEAGRKADGTPLKIGVIDLPSFYMDMTGARLGVPDFRSTTRDVRKILDDFNRDNVDALVLDLRRNGGGSLTEAINLTGLFIETGAVVQVKGPDGPAQPYSDNDSSISWTKPMVVMISKFSASASEILAGAIQDYHRGLIVGDHTTHGKGTVQSMLDIGHEVLMVPNALNMGALKMTMQQFYRPSGDSTQHRGVVADIELPSITTHLDVGEADLEYSLPFDRVAATRYPVFPLVEKPAVQDLNVRSQARVAKSSDFQKVARSITRYEEQKKRKRVTLNEKAFLELNKEVNAEKEEEKMLNPTPDAKGIQRNFYLDEVMNITVDYVGLLAQGGAGPQLAGPKASDAPQ
jgi:carboxyl-terminal processing protease